MTKSLETENQGENNPRYELKMVAQEMTVDLVKSVLRLDGEGFHEAFPKRVVQSLYLDTPGNRALEDNLAGISHREKLRLRWYGEENIGVSARLENKVRRDSLGWKKIQKFATIDIANVSRHDFMRYLRQTLPAEWASLLNASLEPVQWICYERQYFASADNAIRVTLDLNLRAWDQRGKFRLANRFATYLPRMLIVEVKCAKPHYQRARAVISRLPLFVGKCSKFVMASSPGEGPILSPHY